jgi:hypothetical protein
MCDGLSEAALRSLRVAATLAAVAPSVRVRICDGEQLLTEVHRPPLPTDATHRVVPPCVFRLAVAHACEIAALGRAVAFAGLPAGADPTIHIGLASGDLTLPGGIWRIGHHDRWTHLFATTLTLADAMGATTDGADPPAPGAWVRLGFHHDELTGVTLVHVTGPAGDKVTAARDRDVLEATLARCATAELLADIDRPPEWRRRPPA